MYNIMFDFRQTVQHFLKNPGVYLYKGKMALRQQITRRLAPFAFPVYGGMGTIVMLHQILPQSMFPEKRYGWVQNYQHSVEFIENIIQWFAAHNYEAISIADLAQRLNSKSKKRFVMFTVDDGYADSFLYCRPVLKKWNIPWTLYVSTDFPDRKILFPAHLIENRLLAGESSISIEMPDGKTLACSKSNPAQCDMLIGEVTNLKREIGTKKYRKWCIQQFGKDLEKLTRVLTCSWDQLREMVHDDNVTIGSHGLAHVHLPTVTSKEMEHEITESRKILELQLGIEVEHFCYPFGTISKQVCDNVRQAGYKTAVATMFGNLFPQNLDHMFALPRVHWYHNDFKNFYTTISGIDGALINRGRRLYDYNNRLV